MSKAPHIDANQFGAALDAIATVQALMFSMLAAPEDREALAGLLDQLGASEEMRNTQGGVRSVVLEGTARALRDVSRFAAKHPVGDEARQ